MTNKPSFFAELKRRNVYKVAVAYAVVGWLVMQVAATVVPALHLPDVITSAVVVVALLGFPVALVIAWAFEMTPEGMKRTENVSPDEVIPQWSRRKFATFVIAIAIIAAALLAFQFLRLRAGRHMEGGTPATPDGQSLAGTRPPIPQKSIAVLPFENLSEDKANAYFAEGIQDEILTRLAKIGALKVISRTSTQHYKSSPENLPEIARQLGVANIVEGSVQKAGDAVHVNVQLIRAATDDHLWAESYNRKLDDIFGVEGEVAGAIAEALNAKLSGNEKQALTARPTNNPAAYDAYLRGLAFQGRPDALVPNILSSIQAFEKAVQLDPDFALAWAQLSRQESFIFSVSDQSPQRREAARKALETAVKLGPDLVETEIADGFYRYWVERDYEAAKARFEAVRAQYPNNPWPPYSLAAIARRQGQWDKSRLMFAQAIDLNPQDVFLLIDASLTDIAMRDAAAAQKHLGRVRDLSPENSALIAMQANSLQLTGDIAGAQALLARAQPVADDINLVNAIVSTAIFSRNYAQAIGVLKGQLEKPQALGMDLGVFWNNLADLQRLAGERTAAESYQRARVALEAASRDQPENAHLVCQLAWAYAGLGNKSAALEHAHRAVALLPTSKDAWSGPDYEEYLARIQARFGDKESAITALQHLLTISYGGPPVTRALLRVDPDWDNLRDDPRFQKLLIGQSQAPEAEP
jgi:TolB-like protein/Tfp pilus assembly protein PilF